MTDPRIVAALEALLAEAREGTISVLTLAAALDGGGHVVGRFRAGGKAHFEIERVAGPSEPRGEG